jgi:hypothetical protein
LFTVRGTVLVLLRGDCVKDELAVSGSNAVKAPGHGGCTGCTLRGQNVLEARGVVAKALAELVDDALLGNCPQVLPEDRPEQPCLQSSSQEALELRVVG